MSALLGPCSGTACFERRWAGTPERGPKSSPGHDWSRNMKPCTERRLPASPCTRAKFAIAEYRLNEMINRNISKVVQGLAPDYYKRRYWRRRFYALRDTYHEQELYLAPFLCDKDKTSIDIGADTGIYAIHTIGVSRDCLAFEPRKQEAETLREMARFFVIPVQVEAVALSANPGNASLRVLEKDPGRSTIEHGNALEDPDGSERSELTVITRRLDDYDLDAVGFIKIDVEGHELSVLHGATATIERCRPILLIEVEERHKPDSASRCEQTFGQFRLRGIFFT